MPDIGTYPVTINLCVLDELYVSHHAWCSR